MRRPCGLREGNASREEWIMSRYVHFELPADNPERAVKFYEQVFGWKAQKWDGPMEYWMLSTGEPDEPGIDGAIAPRQEQFTIPINTIGVDSVDEVVRRVEAAGGKIVVPKHVIPGAGWLIYFADTEGNVSGAMQSDPAAA